MKQPARNRHPCPSALLSVAPLPTFQKKSRKPHLSPFPTKMAWPHGHFSCRLRILGSEALATETQKPQTSQRPLDHGLFSSDQGGGTKKHRFVKLCVHKSSDAWFGQCQKWHRWPVPPETSQRLLDHGLLPVTKGLGPRKADLSSFEHTSHLMHGLWSLPESATAKALASKSAPLPFLLEKETQDLTEQLFGQEDVKSD